MNKVIFLIDTLQVGGAEKSLLEITSRFKNYKPIVFQLFDGDALYNDYIKAGIEVKRFNFNSNENLFKISQSIISDIKLIQPKIIHSTLFRSNIVSRHVKLIDNICLINSFVNNSYSKQRYRNLSLLNKIKLFRIQMWDKSTANLVDHFVSNSTTIKYTNALKLGVSQKNITVIYRGRNINKFQSPPIFNINKSYLNLNLEEKIIFLNVSRLIERKGQLDLIRAFSLVYNLYPQSVLLIAGEGPHRLVLENEIQKLNLQNAVFLLGNRNDVDNLLRVADYFVFPSHFEGLPGALIEAMLAKIPIIASRIPENIECVSSDMALLFKCGNFKDLAEKMIKSLSSSDWENRCELAFNYASNNFDIDSIAAQYEILYDLLTSV